MDIDIIKQLLRKQLLEEGLIDKLRKKRELRGKRKDSDKEIGSRAQTNQDKEEKDSGDEQRNTKKDYSDIQGYFEKEMSFPQSSVMVKLGKGWENDEGGINRSRFGKKLWQERNPEGGLYQFSDDEVDIIRTAIKNKA